MGKKVVLPLGKRRPSKSADGVRNERIAEELAMTPRERVLEALELGEWVSEVFGARGDKSHEEP